MRNKQKKSEVFFSPNVEAHLRDVIVTELEVRQASNQTKYLGLPSIIGRKKKDVFQTFLDKVRKKTAGWKERNLSIGEKGSSKIRHSSNADVCYDSFSITGCANKRATSCFQHFWWGHGNKENPIRWSSWEYMCISKDHGGLGFRRMNGFNRLSSQS